MMWLGRASEPASISPKGAYLLRINRYIAPKSARRLPFVRYPEAERPFMSWRRRPSTSTLGVLLKEIRREMLRVLGRSL